MRHASIASLKGELYSMAKPKILLVDDVKLMLELEKSFLRFSPVRVLTAANGEEALEVIRNERPSLVYMDMNMPKMGGAACCSVLKADPELSDIPVIMVTTAGRTEDEELCRTAGCDGYITKPVDKKTFLDIGRKFLPDIDRREPRVAVSAFVSCTRGDAGLEGVTADISIGGLYMAVNHAMAMDQEVDISLTLPGSDSIIKARGRVAWLNSPGARPKPRLPEGFGVEFSDISPEDLEVVHKFVESLKPSR